MSIAIIDDARYEPAGEAIEIALAGGALYNLGAQHTHTITVADNDALPRVSFYASGVQVNEQVQNVKLTLLSDAESDADVIVGLTFSNHSAQPGSDYQLPASSTVVIPAGSRSASTALLILDDSLGESTETIVVGIGSVTGGILASGAANPIRHVVAINSNDAPVVSFESTFRKTSEAAGTIAVRATLSNPVTSVLSVPFIVSGTAGGADYTIASNQFTFAPNSQIATTNIQIIDDSLANEEDESVVLNLQPSATGSYLVAPRNRYVLNIVDDDAIVARFLNTFVPVWEDAGSASITAILSNPSATAFSLPITISSDYFTYASYGYDFTMSSAPLFFAPGQTTATRTITIVNDAANEPTETIRLGLSTVVGVGPGGAPITVPGVSLAGGPVTIGIRDDDPLVWVTSGPPLVTEGNTDVDFSIRLSTSTNKTVTIPFTLSGTAGSADYSKTSPMSSFVTIPSGQSLANVRIRVNEDSIDEPNESITLKLGSSIANATLSSPISSTFTILDDDSTPTVGFSTKNFSITENAKGTAVKVQLSRPSSRDVVVALGFGGTAKLGEDYTVKGTKSSKLTIKAGQTSGTFTVTPINDSSYEGNEAITVTIKSAENAVVDKYNLKRTVTIVDNDSKPTSPKTKPSSSTAAGTLAIGTSGGLGAYPIGSGPFPTNVSTVSGPLTAGSLMIGAGSQGLLSQAIAFLDANFNGVHDFLDIDGNGVQGAEEPQEPHAVTELDGSFSLFFSEEFDLDGNGLIESHEGRLVLADGIDTSTNLPWATTMAAPLGVFAVTPLSTLAESLVRIQGFTVDDAVVRVTEAFGIEGYALATSNPLYQILSNDALAVRAYAAHVQIHSTVVQIGELFAGESDLDVTYLAQIVYDDLAERIAAANSELSLVIPELLEGIINGIAVRTGITLSAIDASGAANVIAAGNAAIDALDPKNFVSSMEFAKEVVKTKKVSQGDAAVALRDVGKGTRAIAEVVDAFTGANLVGKIALESAGRIVPPAIGVGDARIVEGNGGQQFLEFEVGIVGDHDFDVSVDYTTADDTALESEDYQSVSGTLTWMAGDVASKFVQVPILGDTVFEGDESVRLLLTNNVDSVIRIQQGYGFILNDDALTFTTSSTPPAGSNEFAIILSEGETSFFENSTEVLIGEFANGVSGEITGRDNVSDVLAFDFTANTYRADIYHVNGGLGAEADALRVVAGMFASIEHTIVSEAGGTTTFSPLDDDELVVTWDELEAIALNISAVDTLTIRFPASVTSIILEDADISEPGACDSAAPRVSSRQSSSRTQGRSLSCR